MKLYVLNDNMERGQCTFSEKMSVEILFQYDDGWILKFSKTRQVIL